MKFFNHLLIISSFVLLTTNLSAQTFIVKWGYTSADIDYKLELGNRTEIQSIDGFHGGLVFEIPVSKVLKVETGLMIDHKGFLIYDFRYAIVNHFPAKHKLEIERKLTYADIPMSLKAYANIRQIKLFVLAGPIFGIGVKGYDEYKETLVDDIIYTRNAVEWGDNEENDHVRRFDYGLLLGAGVEYEGILLHVHYQHGLQNTIPNGGSDEYIKNRVLSLGAGIKFGSSKSIK